MSRDPTRFDLREILLENTRSRKDLEERSRVIKAFTIGVDDNNSPAVSGREKYVWVRESGMNGAVHQVFNPDSIPMLVDFPCLITYTIRKPFRWEIYGTDWDTVYNFPGYSNQNFGIGTHAPNHEWLDGNQGTDPVSVYPRALAPLRTYAGTGLAVNVWAYKYWYEGEIKEFTGASNFDLSALQPASGYAVRILVYLQISTNSIVAVAGTAIGDSDIVIPPDPAIPNNAVLSAFVRLDGDQTSFTESDITDLRMLLTNTVVTDNEGVTYVTLDMLGDVEAELDELITWLHLGYPGVQNTTRVTTTYTVTLDDEVVFCDTDGGAFTVTLPAGVEGKHLKIINCGSSANDLTVDGDGAETVYGAATQDLSDGEVIDIHYNTTEGWW